MPLNLVLGPANSAKAGEVLGAYAAASWRDALLVVPTAADADHYLRELAAGGCALGSVTTFAGLAEEIARRAGYRARRLSPLARRRVVRRVLAGLRLERLAAAAHGAGFALAAERLVVELERALITPQRFAQALSAWAADDARRAPYARELGRLPLAYASELERIGAVDPERFAWGALDALRARPAAWGATEVFLYGFDDLLGVELDAVETLARVVGVEVTVSLTYEAGRAALSARDEVVQELRALAETVRELPPVRDHYAPAAAEVLHHLERGLFEPGAGRVEPRGAVRLLEAGGELAQAELVAAEVLALGRRGIGPEEVAVVCRAAGRTAATLVDTLERYGVCAAFAGSVSLRRTRLGRTLRALLRCAGGDGEAADLIELLRAPGRGLPERVDALEAEVLQRGLRSAAQAAERWGEWPEEVVALRDADDAGAELAHCVRRLAGLPAGRAAVLEEDESLDARGLVVLLGALQEALELGERLGLTELEALLEDLEVPAGRARPGTVVVAEPLAVRARRFRAVIVCGLNEGEFPAPGRAEPFLSDEQRFELAHASGLRLPGHEDTLARERYLFYACASRASAELVLAYRSSDEEGNLALPSPFIADVADLLAPGWERERGRRLLADVVWPPQEAPTALERARGEAALAPRCEPAAEPRQLSAVALARMRHRDVVSAGALEAYTRCPVAWLVEKQLAPPALAPDSDPQVRGHVIHHVLEQVIQRLDAPLTLHTLPRALEIADEELERAPGAIAAGRGAGVRAGVVAGYRADLRRYLRAEASDGGQWRPWRVELRFGFEDHDSLPELVLGEGEGAVRVRGVIDRVDVDAAGQRAVVRDYKSGAARQEHPAARWAGDGQLQVALYMLAVRELAGLDPVGGFYQPLGGRSIRPRGAFRRGEPLGPRVSDNDARSAEELDEILRDAAARAVEVAERIRSGTLEACPATCSREGCRYPGICRSG